jgi:dTDP-4-dehydrorhamnose 3,5-epimerase
VREASSTFRQVNVLIAGTLNPVFIRVPPGVMHGWKALSRPEAIVLNFQSDVYDPADQIKLPWNCVLPEIWEPRNG